MRRWGHYVYRGCMGLLPQGGQKQGRSEMLLLSYVMACGHCGCGALASAFRRVRHDFRVVQACTGAVEGVFAVTSVGVIFCVDGCKNRITSGVKSASGMLADWATHGRMYSNPCICQ